jgi:signal peptidase I
MTLSQWALFVLLCQVLMFVKLWKLYKKAGYAPYLAAIPFYNSVILLRIIGRPSWWVVLLYFSYCESVNAPCSLGRNGKEVW